MENLLNNLVPIKPLSLFEMLLLLKIIILALVMLERNFPIKLMLKIICSDNLRVPS